MIKQALDRRHAENRPIQVGFVGAGRMGSGALARIGLMRGIRNAMISDLSVERARRAFALHGQDPAQVVVTNNAGVASDAIRPEIGARVAHDSIQPGKQVVMLDVETDVVVGPILHKMATSAGVCYTVSSGDEPGLIAE